MDKNTKIILRRISGITLILIGITGIFLPILPGWIFIFIGIELLGIQLAFMNHIKRFVKRMLDRGKESGK
jgi:uncharacterized membrane protein YbaN (DUF454 family)